MNKVTAATHPNRIPFRKQAPVATITMSGSRRTDGMDPPGSGTTAEALDVASATHQFNMAAALHHQRYASVVAVVATDVDPSQPVWRPRPAPAAVVGGVGVGHADERKAVVAVMEKSAAMRKPCMRKTRTREAAACETDAAARETHAADTHAAAHAADMHSTSMHPPMHAAAHATTTMAAAPMTAAATAAASERGWRKSERRSHHTRGEAIKELAFHPDFLRVELQRPIPSQKEDNQHTQTIH